MLKLVAVILLLESLFAVDLHDFVDDSESLLVFLRQFVNPWHEFLHEALFDDSIDNLKKFHQYSQLPVSIYC